MQQLLSNDVINKTFISENTHNIALFDVYL